MAGRGEAAHIHADLGNEYLGQGEADSGDRHHQLDLGPQRGKLAVDLLAQAGDAGIRLIDGPQHRGDHEGVVLGGVRGACRRPVRFRVQRPGLVRPI